MIECIHDSTLKNEVAKGEIPPTESDRSAWMVRTKRDLIENKCLGNRQPGTKNIWMYKLHGKTLPGVNWSTLKPIDAVR